MAKANATGRKDDGKHVRLYRYLWPPMLERLDGNAFKALFYMLTFEDGANNGAIYMGARTLADGINVSKRTALRCLEHLDRQGFIRPEQLGYFQQKGGPATRWRITFLPANGSGPTNEWRQPAGEQKSWVQFLHGTGAEIAPAHSKNGAAGAEIAPVEATFEQVAGAKSGTQTIAIGEAVSGKAETSSNTLVLAGGPIATDADPAQLIRSQLTEWWRLSAPKARQHLAKQHKLEIGDLLNFIDGGALPFPKLAAIRSTIAPSRTAA